MGQLTFDQRCTIQQGIAQNLSEEAIGTLINKEDSVDYRKLKRNAAERNNEYRAELAHNKALNRYKFKAKKIS